MARDIEQQIQKQQERLDNLPDFAPRGESVIKVQQMKNELALE